MTRSPSLALALHPLPLRDAHLFLNDSGLETTLVFHEGMTLPAFAAFPLLETAEGRAVLSRYYARHLAIAERHATGFVLDTPTWRANPDWAATLGYDAAALDRINAAACAFCQAIREEWQNRVNPIVLSGIVGPRGDGYIASFTTAAEAEDYHTPQIAAFARAGADMVAAYTLTTIDEAVGIAWAAREVGIPAVVSFTLETDGRLVSGEDLGAAIETVDAATGGSLAYFMINCAHPTHFADRLAGHPAWAQRIGGVKANASTQSHAELDAAEILDDGDPEDLGARYLELRGLLPALTVLGGCCGTDHRHIAAIADAWCASHAMPEVGG